MQTNSIFAPFASSNQWVPMGAVLGPTYNTKDMNNFWFSEQISRWVNQNDYSQIWQTNDTNQFQFITNGIAPVKVDVYKCSNNATPFTTIDLTNVTSPAINSPLQFWRGSLSMATLAALSGFVVGGYYFVATAGSGGNLSQLITERQNIQVSHTNSILFEFRNSTNKQAMIFDDAGVYSFRVDGFFDNRFKPKYKGAFYIDQLQDASILNAIAYGTTDLWVGMGEGIPDWVIQKVARIMLFDTVNIDGIGYSLDEGAEWEETFTPGAPKKYWKTTIRRATNIDGISANLGTVDTSTVSVESVDANAIGPNFNNVGGNTTPDLIQITVS